ncbi:conserved membrane protein of unknown function [Tepidanaerobacter acetatoxydans Re1]|uniref:DUF1468 domain-containing protein n=1 Tax=Tepidanaerobacter acetatoxydans (strain DSM 21804 / JCM 16047 / Re1) TaxID=1209989 RepID=F4LR70_TEPAE|nr:tripartite tricarboxylate transporter TctB family protein [Tepidanaerobacter acetatoxydans]AEE92223.1 hypothetical protein TepRe1_2100 [Tepidanaerobacter acetatoxydans Re1]CCP27093.1 conserved membrane protein of unknown function [Tepidanaerobacter acetatoxydans Re1]
MKRINIVTGIIFIALSIFIFVQSLSFQQTMITDNFIGAAFFPRMIAVIMLILSAILIVSSILEKDWHNDTSSIFKWETFKFPLIGVIVLLIYIMLLDKLGFIIDTIILNIVLLSIFRYNNKILTLLLSCAITLAIFQVFQRILMVPLPSGLLGF